MQDNKDLEYYKERIQLKNASKLADAQNGNDFESISQRKWPKQNGREKDMDGG